MELEKAFNGLKKTKVKALIIKKKKNSLIKMVLALAPYGRISLRFENSEKNHYFFDFIDMKMKDYKKVERGDVINIVAYGGQKNSHKLYLRPDEALLN